MCWWDVKPYSINLDSGEHHSMLWWQICDSNGIYKYDGLLTAVKHFWDPYIFCRRPNSRIHCLIICGIQLLTPNSLGETWRHICSPDIRNVSALEVLRNRALHLLAYLQSLQDADDDAFNWLKTTATIVTLKWMNCQTAQPCGWRFCHVAVCVGWFNINNGIDDTSNAVRNEIKVYYVM